MSETRVYLRGVDLAALTEKYISGSFAHVIEPLTIEPKKSCRSAARTILKVREEIKKKSYQVDIGPGESFYCLGYKIHDKEGNYSLIDSPPTKSYRCMFCLRKIEDFNTCLGIPIKREKIDGKLFYHMIDIFCKMGCVYAEIKRRIGNPVFSQSMSLLSEIYMTSTGEDFSKLKPSSDPRLLKIMNGPMTWDEYHSDSNVMTPDFSKLYFLPVLEYLEQVGTRQQTSC